MGDKTCRIVRSFVLVLSEAVLVLRPRKEPTPAYGHPSSGEDFEYEDDDEDDRTEVEQAVLSLRL